jgi:hypothetical protein
VASEPGVRRRLGAEDGNTLLLMPAAILVMVVLAAIAIDFAVMYTAQREAAVAADGVARAATGAVDEQRLFDDGVYVIDLGRADAAAASVLAARPADDGMQLRCGVPRHGATPDVVVIDCRASVDLVFRPALSSGGRTFEVSVTGTARAAED